MGYSYKEVKKELVGKYQMSEELVSWGNVKYVGGTTSMFSTMNPFFAFCMNNKNLVIVPFTNSEILFDQAKEISSKDIKTLTFKKSIFTCFFSIPLYLELNDGTILKFAIVRPYCKDMKKMIKKLGF